MSNCKCSMAISVNGDGCRYCQPQEYIDKLAEWLEESRADYAALESECAALRKRAKVAECEAHQALKALKGLEKVAKVVSDNSDRVCGELNLMTQKYSAARADLAKLEAGIPQLMQSNYDLRQERYAALDERERLRGLPSHESKAESRPEFMQIIDAALSAKPTEG